MDYFSRVNFFLEVAKYESFTKAAEKLNISSSAVSKQIQNLEYDLQVQLFNRTTRQVTLTEEGRLLYKRARYAIDSLEEAREELTDLKTTPKGLLRVSVPLSLGLQYLKKPIAHFAKLYPDVIMDVSFEDRFVNLAEEDYDIALRIGELKDSTLIAKRLAPINVGLYASPEYLNENSAIKSPEDLLQHNFFEYTRSPSGHLLHYQTLEGLESKLELQSRFLCDSVELMKEAAQAGIGIFLSPQIFVQAELDRGLLVPVLQEYKTVPQRNLYAVFPANRYLSRRLRLFIDYISQELPF